MLPLLFFLLTSNLSTLKQTKENNPLLEDIHCHGCLLIFLPHFPGLSHTSDKIDSRLSKVTNPTPTHYQNPSESPYQGPLNLNLPLSSPSSRSAATIFSHDYQSFITDNPQTWLSQSPSQRLMPATQPDFTQNPSADFVLFPPSTSSRPARHSTELPPATSRTVPSSTFGQSSIGQSRRNSTHQSPSGASVQDPRVTRIIIQGNGHRASSSSFNRFSPSGQKPQFYASSAPSSSSALQQQQQPSNRPPVPLFPSNSTGNIPQQRNVHHSSANMHVSTMHSGISTPRSGCNVDRKLKHTSVTDMTDMFDLPADFGEDVAHDTSLFDSSSFSSPQFTTINDPAPVQVPFKHVTVSPKDLMVGPTSAPPSTTFTNYTSPSIWDSPDVAESFETSPLIFTDAELGTNTDSWPSLFPDNSGQPEEMPIVPTEDMTKSSPYLVTVGTNGMARQRSSPGQSPHASRGTPRHSSVSGVNARKRDKPLPPITVRDPTDTVELKRARNTAAARKSRQKKVERVEELEKQVEELQTQVEHWRNIALARGVDV